MCLDWDHDQNHESYQQDNQNGMNSLELSTPDFCHEVIFSRVYASKLVTEELHNSLDDYLLTIEEGIETLF